MIALAIDKQDGKFKIKPKFVICELKKGLCFCFFAFIISEGYLAGISFFIRLKEIPNGQRNHGSEDTKWSKKRYSSVDKNDACSKRHPY